MKNWFFLLLISATISATQTTAQQITLKQIGKEFMMTGNSVGLSVRASGILYSFDQSGSINKTDLATGEQSRIGKQRFNNLRFFFTLNSKLYVIDTDGSMTQIDPVSGATTVVSNMGYWNDIARVMVVGNTFYAIENSLFYRYYGFNTASRKQIGEAEFYNVGTLIKYENLLYSLIDDGSFYEISTSTGVWKKIARSKSWRGNLSAVVKEKLYTVDNSGVLFETTLSDGSKKQLDDIQFKKSKHLFEEGGKLYTSTMAGTLFEVVFN